jgi:hypothetical protein
MPWSKTVAAAAAADASRSPPSSKKRIMQRVVQQQQQQQQQQLRQQTLNFPSMEPMSSSQSRNGTTSMTSLTIRRPLPGGCHGRTSRTHFYCKRRPCYKKSNYCKLHYQQYVLAATSVDGAASNGEGAAATTTACDEEDSVVYCQETALPGSSKSSSTTCFPDEKEASEQQQQQPSGIQNRRYTGRSCEQRCLATTTRGRPCAYVASAQHGGKYCHMHADYDIHPAPRRGGTTSIAAVAAAAVNHVPNSLKAMKTINNNSRSNKTGGTTTNGKPRGSRSSLAFRPSSSLVSITSSLDSSAPSSTLSELKSVKRDRDSDTTATVAVAATKVASVALADSGNSSSLIIGPMKRCTTAKMAKKHADSPFPLLSMFSTDQWMAKKVRIAIGPLAGRTAKVEKWSNGWVSVRVPGVGLHNRRSFELYLVAQSQPPSQKEKEEHGESQGKQPSDMGVEEADTVSEEEEQKRALLRCVSREAASPSPLTMTKPISTSSSKKKSSEKSADAAKNRHSAIGPTEIPQSPCPTRCGVMDILRTPVIQHVVTNLVPKVTPCLPKLPGKDVPLVHSLFLAQEGNGKMDLLFGTAALERSRRTVRKPTLYQDTEMLDKKQGGGGGRTSNSDVQQHIPFKKRVTGPSYPTSAEIAGKVDG